jgi:hypothetical protein
MNSAQIDYALRRDPCTSVNWHGVYPIDYLKDLPTSCLLPAAYVVNTAPSSHDGIHWVSFYFTDEGAEFFDSYGCEPKKPEMTKFLQCYGHLDWTRNHKRLQGSGSTVCGQFAIFFITLRARGWTMKEIEKQFGDDYKWNDGLVTAFANKHFNLNTKEINYDFLIQSVCPLEA